MAALATAVWRERMQRQSRATTRRSRSWDVGRRMPHSAASTARHVLPGRVAVGPDQEGSDAVMKGISSFSFSESLRGHESRTRETM